MRKGNDLTDAELDRILADERVTLPSSSFAASVMDAVRREAAMRPPKMSEPPISFPWHIFLSGMAACLALPCVLLVLGLRDSASTSVQVQTQSQWAQAATALAERFAALMTNLPADLQQVGMEAAHHAVQTGAGWVLFALVLSWASVQWSVRA